MTFSTNKYQSTALRLCKIEVANKKRGPLFALTSNTKVRRNEKCRLKNAIVLILIASLLLLLTKNQSPSLWFQWKVALSTFQSSWSCLYPSADDQSLLWKQPRYSFNLLGLSLFGVKWWPWLAWNNNKKFISIPSLTLLLLFEWRRSQYTGRGMSGATNLTRNSKIILR